GCCHADDHAWHQHRSPVYYGRNAERKVAYKRYRADGWTMDAYAGIGGDSAYLHYGLIRSACIGKLYCRIPYTAGSFSGECSINGNSYAWICFFSFVFTEADAAG